MENRHVNRRKKRSMNARANSTNSIKPLPENRLTLFINGKYLRDASGELLLNKRLSDTNNR